MVALKGPRYLVALVATMCALVLVSAPGAVAAEVSTGEDVRVATGETIPDDMYARSSEVTIDGTVRGDVVALADHVVINGTVEGSVWTLARTVQVNGRVGGSVRAIAVSLTIGAPAEVDRDVVVVGYSVISAPESTVEGDVWAWTYQGQHAGSIGRNYVGRHAGLELGGSIGGYARVEVGPPTSNTPFNPAYALPDVSDVPTVARGLSIANQAHIAGGVTVLSSETSAPAPGALEQFATSMLNFGRDLLPLLVVCALLLWLWPTHLDLVADTAASCPGTSLGWGIVLVVGILVGVYCLVIIALVVAALCALAGLTSLAVVTAGAAGVSVTGILLVLFVFWAWVSKVVLGRALMTWVARPFRWAPNTRPLAASLVGTLAIAALVAMTASIPLIGVAVDSLIAFVGLGATLVQNPHVVARSVRVQSVSPRSVL